MKSSLRLDGNTLKIIAAISMFVDHMGHILFPGTEILRIIGRISFPIFAFMIAEGCLHTKNKLKYFLAISILGVLCQVVYYIFDKSFDMCILVTFSLSVLVIYALQRFESVLRSTECSVPSCVLFGGVFLLAVVFVYALNQWLSIDYGFWGCMAPVAASVFRGNDNLYKRVSLFGVILFMISVTLGGNQFYSFLAMPLLLLYSGERGKWRMKYFFYIFYPAHLVILQGVQILREYLLK